MKKQKKVVLFSILILLLIIIFNWRKIKLFDWAIELNENKVVVTREYIRPGWLLKGVSTGKLTIERIIIDSIDTSQGLTYTFFKNNSRVKDSCIVFFGKGEMKKIYFNKEYDWTWDFQCGTSNYSKKKFGFLKNNSFYRISDNLPQSKHKDYVYVYIDNKGEVSTYIAYLNM